MHSFSVNIRICQTSSDVHRGEVYRLGVHLFSGCKPKKCISCIMLLVILNSSKYSLPSVHCVTAPSTISKSVSLHSPWNMFYCASMLLFSAFVFVFCYLKCSLVSLSLGAISWYVISNFCTCISYLYSLFVNDSSFSIVNYKTYSKTCVKQPLKNRQ